MLGFCPVIPVLARKSRSTAPRIVPNPRGIDPFGARLANLTSETSSQLTPPSSGESANFRFRIRATRRSRHAVLGISVVDVRGPALTPDIRFDRIARLSHGGGTAVHVARDHIELRPCGRSWRLAAAGPQ